jgi:hypothetical protein
MSACSKLHNAPRAGRDWKWVAPGAPVGRTVDEMKKNFEVAEVIDIPNLMANLRKMYKEKNEGELSKLEIVLGKEGAKKALQGAKEALNKLRRPSIRPWRHDVADAQRMAKQVMVDMASAAQAESNRICGRTEELTIDGKPADRRYAKPTRERKTA